MHCNLQVYSNPDNFRLYLAGHVAHKLRPHRTFLILSAAAQLPFRTRQLLVTPQELVQQGEHKNGQEPPQVHDWRRWTAQARPAHQGPANQIGLGERAAAAWSAEAAKTKYFSTLRRCIKKSAHRARMKADCERRAAPRRRRTWRFLACSAMHRARPPPRSESRPSPCDSRVHGGALATALCTYLPADDYLFILVLIGDSGVGKSCLLLRFAVRAACVFAKNWLRLALCRLLGLTRAFSGGAGR